MLSTTFAPRVRLTPARSRVNAAHAAVPLPSKYSTVKPTGDRVLVKVGGQESKTAGGILLPTAAESEQNSGDVVAVGEAESVKAGDSVMFSRYTGTRVKIGEEEHIIMKETDILGTSSGSVANLKPIEDRILIKVAEDESTSAGGVILTAASSQKPTIGEVVAAGPGRKGEDGKMQTPTVSAGDQVLYSKYSGVELEDGDDKYVVVRSTDVLAALS